MGMTTFKQIQSNLQSKYKPIRKYYNHFYGEITVIENRSNHEYSVKVMKEILPDKRTLDYIERRVHNTYSLLANLKAYYPFSVDMCAQNTMCLFILQYFPSTLYEQIQRRQRANTPFNPQQLVHLFYSIIQAIKLLREIDSKNKTLITNSSFLYVGNSKVKVLQSIFSAKNQVIQTEMNYMMISRNSQLKQCYLSPQSFAYFCRKQKMKAKLTALDESSLIFTLGMNFLECALLLDLTQLYNKQGKMFEYQRLQQIYGQVLAVYGEDIQKLISSMTELSPSKRPTLKDVQDYLKYILQIFSNRTTETSQAEFRT